MTLFKDSPKKPRKSAFSPSQGRHAITIFMRLHAGVTHLLSTGGLILATVEAAMGIPSVEPSVTLPRVLRPLLPSEAFERKLGNGSSSMFWTFSMSVRLTDTGLHHMRSDLPKTTTTTEERTVNWPHHELIQETGDKLYCTWVFMGQDCHESETTALSQLEDVIFLAQCQTRHNGMFNNSYCYTGRAEVR